MPDHIPLPAKQYSVIYADPPWAYQQAGATAKARGTAVKHYPTMTTAEICALPVREIVRGGAACFMWATFPNITEAIKVMEAWGFTYKTAAFVWVKKNRKNGGNFMGMGAYTRANAEVCLLGVTPGFKAKTQIRAHNVHQIFFCFPNRNAIISTRRRSANPLHQPRATPGRSAVAVPTPAGGHMTTAPRWSARATGTEKTRQAAGTSGTCGP